MPIAVDVVVATLNVILLLLLLSLLLLVLSLLLLSLSLGINGDVLFWTKSLGGRFEADLLGGKWG